MKFTELNLNNPLLNALSDMGIEEATPIQEKVFSSIMSGRDTVGIAQTGTGKTIAYILPLLRNLKFSKQKHPRILVLVPTRELVEQVVSVFEQLSEYMTLRVVGIYGGANINTQKQKVYAGVDVLVSTPGRLIDIALTGVLRLKSIQKLVIDEVDEMLNSGFTLQLQRIVDMLPERRQNLMFSATLTYDTEQLINEFFYNPIKIETVPVGQPLDNISQKAFKVPNFYTKINMLRDLLYTENNMDRVLVFVKSRVRADLLFENIGTDDLQEYTGVIHSNKSQNFRFRMVKEFTEGKLRILIATDLIARGLDIENITHVVNFDMPEEAETYIHRIGRTGRADAKGEAVSFVTPKEKKVWEDIQKLMNISVDLLDMPEEVEVSNLVLDEETLKVAGKTLVKPTIKDNNRGEAFHEKKDKNKKVNLGGSYRRKLAAKYKKPKTRGQKRK